MRSSFALFSAVTLTAGLVTLPAGAAHAADGLSLSAPRVVLKTQSTTYLTVRVRIEDPTAEWVNIQALGPGSGYQSDILIGDPDGDDVFVGRLSFDRYDRPGTWNLETEYYSADVYNDDGDLIHAGRGEVPGPGRKLPVQRVTKLTSKRTPATVKKGGTFTFTGSLKRFNPDAYSSSAFTPYSKRTVKFYFRPAKAKTWVYKGATATNAKGAFTKRLKTTGTGSWQARFTGVPAYAPSSGPVTIVKVK